MEYLFYNGVVRTMRREQPEARALLVRDGRIAAVGGRAEAEAGPAVRRVDLAGRTLLPGFLDAHSHFAAAADQFLRSPWRTAPPGTRSGTASKTISGGNTLPPDSG